MRRLLRLLVPAVAAGTFASPALAAVSVTYVKPDSYTDVRYRFEPDERVLTGIKEHLVQLGRKYLRDDQELSIEVLDIDLAGRTNVSVLKPDLRVIVDQRGDWPRIRLRYRLETAGRVVAHGEETVSDPSFLSRVNLYPNDDLLRYEKQMLDDWFVQRIVKGRPASS